MAGAEQLDIYSELDQRLVAATRGIRLLQLVSWPASVEMDFVAAWKAGTARLPVIEYPRTDFHETREALMGIVLAAEPGHPLGDYIRRTAQSWRVATELLDAIGTPAISEHSARLFGRPSDRVPGATLTNVDAARHFIVLADEFMSKGAINEVPEQIEAERLRGELQQQLDAFFGAGVVRVETDAELIAKAAAGATRIRLRSATNFTSYDRQQLVEHEAFVHSLTALNGREQPHLKSLARNSPRITATQEGLAVFAELMSGSIDIERMKRISLRIIGIDMALGGADFIEVFRFFLDAGQSETDSFASAQRVFRGAPLGGGAAFTKDTVYLHGLLSVHTFFRWAFKHRQVVMCRNLFSGKLALHDVIALKPYFDNGYIAQPRYLPPWMQHANGLAGMLAFSLFANQIRLDRVEAEDLVLGL
ncbi:MAG TPA: flavohemoglobin expression-modulating QEGLA motif protein [Rhodanobacteraceae bacterium]|nr:flavohemoglobin expression-modulating QEGLA motif protein [Rhodanobacteraceae bacterium]